MKKLLILITLAALTFPATKVFATESTQTQEQSHLVCMPQTQSPFVQLSVDVDILTHMMQYLSFEEMSTLRTTCQLGKQNVDLAARFIPWHLKFEKRNVDDVSMNTSIQAMRSLIARYPKIMFDVTLDQMKQLNGVFEAVCNNTHNVTIIRCENLSDSAAKALADGSALQNFTLKDCENLTASAARFLAGCSTLRSINLTNCSNLTDDSVIELAACSTLQSVELDRCYHLTDAAAVALARCRNLQSVSFSECNLTDASVRALAACSTLRRVEFEGYENLDEDAVRVLAGCSNLQSISFKECGLTAPGFRALASCSTLQNITWHCSIVDIGARISLADASALFSYSVLSLATFPDLQSVNFSSYHLDDAVVRSLVASCSTLRSVVISKCQRVTDDGVASLCALSALQSIDLSVCMSLTDTSASHLSKHPSLLSINLSRCFRLTDDGVASLCALSALQSIDLSRCERLTDASVASLSTLPSLRSVNLSYCPKLTDNSVALLATLPALRFVYVLKHMLRTNATAKLRAILKNSHNSPLL